MGTGIYQTFTTVKGVQIEVEEKYFKKGGEGKVHKIKSSSAYPQHCIKFFNPTSSTSPSAFKSKRGRNRRLIHMIQNTPAEVESSNFRICWPVDVVADNEKNAKGFIMPLAFAESQQLAELCQSTLRKALPLEWHQNFSYDDKSGLIARMKLCINIAAAIHKVHADKNYVLVDLKPENILVTPSGKVSLIDCDSIQIQDSSQVLFGGTVASPEYAPPESEIINIKKEFIPQSWDRFSLAVIFYKILFGIHPYSHTFQGLDETNSNFFFRIRNNLFAHGNNRSRLTAIPHLHEKYKSLPHKLRILFFRAFEYDVHGAQNRPTAEEWGHAFFETLQSGRISADLLHQRKPPQNTPQVRSTKTVQNNKTNDEKWWPVALSYTLWTMLFITIMILIFNT